MQPTKGKYIDGTLGMCIRVLFAGTLMANSAYGSQWHPIWGELYKELHDGANPNWNTFEDVKAWTASEKDRLEPLVLQILRGDRPDKHWAIGMMVGRTMPTPAICDLLLDRVGHVVAATEVKSVEQFSGEAGTLVPVIDICVGVQDPRILPVVLRLIGVEDQGYAVMEHCVDALRNLGDDGNSIRALRGIALRKKDVYMDRRCAMAEKVIQARLAGRDIFTNAEEELRQVTAQFVRAIEQRDVTSFAAVQPYGFRQGVDEEEFTREILPHPEMPEIVRSLEEVAAREKFQIDRENYQATLVVDDRYRFTYVLEVDGWKISGPIRIGP